MRPNLRRIVAAFERVHPATEREALLECNVSLRHLASGAFRNVYVVGNAFRELPLVVKFPQDDKHPHAQREMRVYRRILRFDKYKALRPYLPKLYYMHYRTGVILMPRYQDVMMNDRMCQRLNRLDLAEVFGNVMGLGGKEGWDGWAQNFGYDARGQIVLLDLGCLEPTRDFAGHENEST